MRDVASSNGRADVVFGKLFSLQLEEDVTKVIFVLKTEDGGLPEDKLTVGQGLMQVDKAHEYIQKSHDIPSVWYKIKTNQVGKPTPTSRGIYLRDSCYCHQSTKWTVQVDPTFHDDANNMEQLVPFEECIELHSTGEAVVKAPGFLLLTHNGRTFNIVVDRTNLSDGLHYYEVYGVDYNAPWCGPLFRIPITITKPISIAFHGININKEEVVLDGSEAHVRIDAQALLSSETLVPAAVLNQMRIPYRPVDAKLHALTADKDRLPSGKQTLALTLTYKFKLEAGANLQPQIPWLNNRIYDNKFESQFYMISDSNKVEGLIMDIAAAEEITNGQELEEAKQAVIESENKLKYKEETAFAAMAAKDAAEKSLKLAHLRSLGLATPW
ncbi:hypothetical protein POM88_019835 [Heracleum sosnowskyi]|uniref:Uncharacterized protein n=1 Tax=Heracleum sosnowskyi TaxID=360622 RepID=A0AAD8IAV2_9APIA|nr:hypothetical protein POM88_019835 [Heracleum sosnowskyi]